MCIYPFRLKPIYKQRIWGGQKLRQVFGKDIPAGEKIGESWELADLPDDKSVIENGELAGQALADVIRKYSKDITGNEGFNLPFPLLIKFLDAQDILSVQVHPDSQTCKLLGKGEPKIECWYIIAAEPGAAIYKGLKHGVTREQFAQAIKEGTVAELLTKVPVKAGQCHFLPAGTAHSIGPGLLIAEIQTPSDTTYRVFDFNRVDDTGKPRPLHIEEALQSIHFDISGEDLPVTTVGRLVDCEYFKVDKGHQLRGSEVLFSPRPPKAGLIQSRPLAWSPCMKTLIFVSGSGTIFNSTGGIVEFKAGDCLLIPAAYEGVMTFADDTEHLTITI